MWLRGLLEAQSVLSSRGTEKDVEVVTVEYEPRNSPTGSTKATITKGCVPLADPCAETCDQRRPLSETKPWWQAGRGPCSAAVNHKRTHYSQPLLKRVRPSMKTIMSTLCWKNPKRSQSSHSDGRFSFFFSKRKQNLPVLSIPRSKDSGDFTCPDPVHDLAQIPQRSMTERVRAILYMN